MSKQNNFLGRKSLTVRGPKMSGKCYVVGEKIDLNLPTQGNSTSDLVTSDIKRYGKWKGTAILQIYMFAYMNI